VRADKFRERGRKLRRNSEELNTFKIPRDSLSKKAKIL